MAISDEHITAAADALRHDQPIVNSGSGMAEVRLPVSREETQAVCDLLRQPRFSAAASRLFPDVPPAPRPTLVVMQAEIARIAGRVPQAEPPAQPVAQPAPAPVEPTVRERVIAAHAQSTLPRGMESPQ